MSKASAIWRVARWLALHRSSAGFVGDVVLGAVVADDAAFVVHHGFDVDGAAPEAVQVGQRGFGVVGLEFDALVVVAELGVIAEFMLSLAHFQMMMPMFNTYGS